MKCSSCLALGIALLLTACAAPISQGPIQQPIPIPKRKTVDRSEFPPSPRERRPPATPSEEAPPEAATPETPALPAPPVQPSSGDRAEAATESVVAEPEN